MWPFIKKTPLRLQINPVECGAAALGIVLECYGENYSPQKLNEVVQISRDGSSAHNIIKAAETLGFSASAKRVGMHELKKAELCILFFDNAHFVVLEGFFAKHFYINDPALGRYKLSPSKMRERYSGVAIFVKPEKISVKMLDILAIFRCITPLSIIVLMLGIASGWLLSLVAYTGAVILIKEQSFRTELLFLALTVILGLILGTWYHLRRRYLNLANERKTKSLLINIKKVVSSFFSSRPLSEFANVIDSVSSARSFWALEPLFYFGICIVLFLLLVEISWLVAMLALAFSFFVFLLQRWALLRLEIPDEISIQSSLRQSFYNYPDLDAMGQGSFLFDRAMLDEFRTQRAGALFWALWLKSLALLPFLLMIAIVFYSTMGPEKQAAAIFLQIALFFTLGLWAQVFKTKSVVKAGFFLKELELLAQNRPLIDHCTNGALLSIKKGGFAYPNEQSIFNDLNIELFPKTLNGLIGPPLSGTSTLLKLMAQNMPWQKGSMCFSGQKWALLDRDAELFSGSLWDNVTLFDPHIDESSVVEALYNANIEELFLNRPLGLLSHIDDFGANLSGGQKKRLLLARALAHKPELLLLDNFFDSLEQSLSLSLLMKLKSLPICVVFTSSNKSELELADRLIVLGENGESS